MIKYLPSNRNIENKYIDILNETLGNIELNSSEERFVKWIIGWDDWTIKNFNSIIKKCKNNK